ncbi:MAG: hypothetical protein AAFS10_15030, partial [Myxococcota bacterium]
MRSQGPRPHRPHAGLTRLDGLVLGLVCVALLGFGSGCGTLTNRARVAPPPSCSVEVATKPKPFNPSAHRACGYMDAETCGHHGWDLLKGHGVPRNVERARLLLDDACAQGFETACVYLHGTVTPGSPEEGHMLGHLCQHNVYACSQLARRLPVFAQVPSDALSAEVLGQACKAGNAVACNNLGAHLVHSSDPSGVRMGLRLFRDACAQCEPVGCINLGATFDWHGWGAQTKGGRIGRRRPETAVAPSGHRWGRCCA